MGAAHSWWYISGLAFCLGILFLVVSGAVGFLMLRQLIPILQETKDQIIDLGDLAASIVGRAGETMDLVELRVSQTMGQATEAGVSASRQSLGVGSVVAGIYSASRLVKILRVPGRSSRRRRHRGRG